MTLVRDPLALCDSSTLSQEDWRFRQAEDPNISYSLLAHPEKEEKHAWYYVHEMKPNEMFLFKGCDSRQGEPSFTGTPERTRRSCSWTLKTSHRGRVLRLAFSVSGSERLKLVVAMIDIFIEVEPTGNLFSHSYPLLVLLLCPASTFMFCFKLFL